MRKTMQFFEMFHQFFHAAVFEDRRAGLADG